MIPYWIVKVKIDSSIYVTICLENDCPISNIEQIVKEKLDNEIQYMSHQIISIDRNGAYEFVSYS